MVSLCRFVDVVTHSLLFVQLASGTSNVILPSSPNIKEISGLKRLDPGADKLISIFAPGVLVKFGSDHDAEVRALQFIHGRLSVLTPRVLHHAPFTNVVVDPWHWKDGVWYFFM